MPATEAGILDTFLSVRRYATIVSSRHGRASGCSDGNTRRVKVFKAENVDAEKIRRDAFSVEGIDTADFAEVMRRGEAVEPIRRQ